MDTWVYTFYSADTGSNSYFGATVFTDPVYHTETITKRANWLPSINQIYSLQQNSFLTVGKEFTTVVSDYEVTRLKVFVGLFVDQTQTWALSLFADDFPRTFTSF